MTAYYAAIATLLVSLAIIALALLVSGNRLPSAAASAATSTVYRLRSIYFVIILGVVIISIVLDSPI